MKRKRTGFCQDVRLYVLKLHGKNQSHSVFIHPIQLWICMCSFECILCGCGFHYTEIFRKTRQAMALIFAMQLRDIQTYTLAKYGRFEFSSEKLPFLKKLQGYSTRFFKNGVPRYETKKNRFLLGCTSICLETTWQKLESQRVYLSLKTTDLYVQL